MGTDNLFHKRVAKAADAHKRGKAKQAPYERILIVCEGQKTEPYYLAGLRKELRLNPVNIVIADKRTGLDPKKLVEYALEEFKRDSDFNHVFCVFDRDKHDTYHAALDIIRTKRLNGVAKLHPITSIPCFEVWILLHFIYTTAPFQAAAKDSNCALVVRELRKEGLIPGYDKGAKDVFGLVAERLDDAIANAKKLERHHDGIDKDNPSTKVYELVEHLRGLKRQTP